MQTLKCEDQGLLTGIDKTVTNIRIHCQCQTSIWFQKHWLHQ